MAWEHVADELSHLRGKLVRTDAEDAQKPMFPAPAGAPPPTPTGMPSPTASSVSQGEGYRMILISRLDARHAKGELTDEEYEAEKRKIQGGTD